MKALFYTMVKSHAFSSLDLSSIKVRETEGERVFYLTMLPVAKIIQCRWKTNDICVRNSGGMDVLGKAPVPVPLRPHKSKAGWPAIEQRTPKWQPGDRLRETRHGHHQCYNTITLRFSEYSTFLKTNGDRQYLTAPVIQKILFISSRIKDYFPSPLQPDRLSDISSILRDE